MLSLRFKDKKTGKENVKSCFEFQIPEDYFTEDHDAYIFFSGASGKSIPMEHAIHHVRFYDTNHIHDNQDQDTTDEKRDFHGNSRDMIRQKVMSSEQQYTVEAYNQQLIRHNKLYSKLVSEIIANSEMVILKLEELPQHEVVETISKDAEQISSRFSLLLDQFNGYEK